MDESCGVEVEEGLGHLVEDVLAVPLGEYVLADEGVEVDVHVLEDEVDVPVVFGPDDLLQFDDVGVAQLHQKHDFPVGPLGVGRVIKRIEVLLEGFHLFALLVGHFPDVAVSPAADLLDDVESGQNVRFYVLAH